MTTDQTPAGELRAAAQRLRTLAEAATPGPWTYNGYAGLASVPLLHEWDPWTDSVDGHALEPRGKCDACVRAEGGCDFAPEAYRRDPWVAYIPAQYGDTATGRHHADAQLIEAMHPSIVLALADVLEAEADGIEMVAAVDNRIGLSGGARSALALARLVLEAR
jgi:hypothetical protein